jgi:hypothetical protein
LPMATPEMEIKEEREKSEADDPRAFSFIAKIDPHVSNKANYEKLSARERNFMGHMSKAIG